MVDSHCHLTSEPLYNNLEWELQQFIEQDGEYILNVATSINSIQKAIKLQRSLSTKYPNLSYLALGLHPEEFLTTTPFTQNQGSLRDCTSQIRKYRDIIDKNIEHISAIGETGLDYHQLIGGDTVYIGDSAECIEIQKLSFRQHLELAVEYDLPMTIHCRENQGHTDCITDTLELISEIGQGKIRGVLHSYTGSIDFIQDILDLGLYIGYNAIITYKNGENIRENLQKTPLNQVMLETDAPFLPLRRQVNGKKAKSYGCPSDIAVIAQTVADILSISVEKVHETTTESFKNLFIRSEV